MFSIAPVAVKVREGISSLSKILRKKDLATSDLNELDHILREDSPIRFRALISENFAEGASPSDSVRCHAVVQECDLAISLASVLRADVP